MKKNLLSFSLCILSLGLWAQAPKVTILKQNIMVIKEKGRYPIAQIKRDDNGNLRSRDGMMETDRYIAWGTVAKVGNEIWYAYSGDRDAHVCPWGVTHLIRSRDGGNTWSSPETINNTPLDDRDCGLLCTRKGTVILSWFTSVAYAQKGVKDKTHYLRHYEKIPEKSRDYWLGNWIVRTEDGGKTWSEPIRVNTSSPHGPIQLKNGIILNVGTTRMKGEKCVGVEISKNEGKSWRMLSTISTEGFDIAKIHEPHVVENEDGSLVALFRWEPEDRNCVMLQSESTDGGKSWTKMHPTKLWGYPPHLLKLHDGTLLVTYGHRKEAFGERAAVSRDGGKTWSEPITLAPAYNADLGYPSSIVLEDGSIRTFYYQQESPGGSTAIFSTHWKLE